MPIRDRRSAAFVRGPRLRPQLRARPGHARGPVASTRGRDAREVTEVTAVAVVAQRVARARADDLRHAEMMRARGDSYATRRTCSATLALSGSDSGARCAASIRSTVSSVRQQRPRHPSYPPPSIRASSAISDGSNSPARASFANATASNARRCSPASPQHWQPRPTEHCGRFERLMGRCYRA